MEKLATIARDRGRSKLGRSALINFNDYYYFAHVVENCGITAASKALNLPKSKLSKRIAELEARLGARLIQRTSRTFVVTDLGNEFYRHARNILIEARAAESAVKCRLGEHRGTIRVSASPLVSQLCHEIIVADFLRDYPEVHIVQEVLSGTSEIGGRSSDLFIVEHDGQLDDSSMIRRQLLVEPRYLVASPAYVETMPTLATPEDLCRHQLLMHGDRPAGARWSLDNARTGDSLKLHLTPRLTSNDGIALAAAARAGSGIAALPASFCSRHLERGTLRRLLPDWTAGETTITALLPSGHGVLPEVRALLGRLSGGLAGRGARKDGTVARTDLRAA